MAEGSLLNDLFFHALILIPIEFGLLHATPIGPMIIEFFEGIFGSLGFEFAQHAHGAIEACDHAHEALELAAPHP